ncbi:MAG: type II toxin-antitoxin system VapC family toxin [Alphaproteobacteria bacterium]|nr:type II toxin-antitoxin system VapC family toxin [Alphaproteobacteria bacterium]
MYLVDTNVISVAAPARTAAPPSLIAWMDAHSRKLFLSAVTIAEIQDGIDKARRMGARRKADELGAWLETLLHLYSDRVLPFDVEVARVAGSLSDRSRALGRPSGLADVIIAATSIRHRLTLLTRNLRHFEPLGVATHDPFLALPDAGTS